MRVAIQLGAAGGSWNDAVTYVQEAERLGAAVCFVAEAWGTDGVSPLAYLAAKTERILLASGILQIGIRTPALVAQTALTLSSLCNNRFILGLGVSGPQVIEGLHGQPFAHPLGRMRETIDIIRLAFAGERLTYQGRHFTLPRPGGEGKALRLSQPANPDIPIYLATLAPKMLELTGELADGWIGTSFIPRGVAAYTGHLAAGAARAGRHLADLDLSQGGDVGLQRRRRRPGRRAQTRPGVLPRRHGLGQNQFLQRRLQPPRLARRGDPRAATVGDGQTPGSHRVRP